MMRAQKHGMTNGDYVFFYYSMTPDEEHHFRPWESKSGTWGEDEEEERKEVMYTYKQVGYKDVAF